MTAVYRTTSSKHTQNLARRIIRLLPNPGVLCLSGDLGSGKTTFVQGLACALGITDRIISPTFTLLQSYDATHKKFSQLVHCDAYRLTSGDALLVAGLEDFLERAGTLVVIEWPEQVQDILPATAIWLTFSFGKKEHERTINFEVRSKE